MPTLVRNAERGPTVFSDLKNGIQIEWAGAGDSFGGDVQHVPDELVTENVQFLKAVQQGILVVEEASPEIQEKIQLQTAAYRNTKARQEESARASLDHTAERPISTVSIDETGKVTYVPQATGTLVDGVEQEGQIPVIIEPRVRG